MISVVCVYNNNTTLRSTLLKSLAKQTATYELITLDNTGNRFKSAAEALNHGGTQATCDYIMFVHQDMWLSSITWLEEVEAQLRAIPDLGVAGVAGMSERGKNNEERRRWTIDVFDEVYWEGGDNLVRKPEPVQTLDECLLIVPRSVFARLKFDEQVFDGWHLYGADYCLSVAQMALKAYVLSAPCCHSTSRVNMRDLLKYQQRLYAKHRKNFKHIYTWMGELSWLKLKLRLLYEYLGPLYLRIFPDTTAILKAELMSCDSVLDLGCGHNSLVQYFDVPFSVGVELFEPALQESKRKGIHTQYIRADIRHLDLKPKCFDAVIATEVLEHLTKQEGYELLSKMVGWARKKAIVTTPNGYLVQYTYDNNPLQEHKSGWTAADFRTMGYRVVGSNGWKKLRGQKGALKHRPAFFWARFSDLTQKLAYRYPKIAFQLVATSHQDNNRA